MDRRGPNRLIRGARGLVSGLLAWVLVAAAGAQAACRDDVVELRGDWGSARFRVEVADTPESRAEGLMFREEMATGAGMLFVYPRPQTRTAFWMRNTLIPLDMLFFDATGTLRRVHVMARPEDETRIEGGADIQFVLEINGGLARDMGIVEGSQIRHPAIGQEIAAWHC